MECYHFELNSNEGVDHFSLAWNTDVMGRLLQHLQQPASRCHLQDGQ